MLTELSRFAQEMLAFSLVLAFQLALILSLRKPVRRWLGAAACYRLWLLPMLWLPFFVMSPWLPGMLPDMNVAGLSESRGYQSTLLQFLQFDLQPFDSPSDISRSGTGFNAIYAWALLAIVWVAGSVAFVIWQVRRWLNFHQNIMKYAEPLSASELEQSGASAHFSAQMRTFKLPEICGAAIFGVTRPMLLIPSSFNQRYDANQRHIILAHEAVHLARKDNFWNLLALFVLALFWTNPLVILAWRYYRLDQELSCDALALANCSREQQKRYARTLLESLGSLSASGTQPVLSAWDNLRDIKERSIMIKQHLLAKRRPATAVFTLMLLALGGASLTITIADLTSPAVLAAEAAAAANPDAPAIVSDSVKAQLDQITQLMSEEKFAEARVALEPLVQSSKQGQLNTEESLQILQMSVGLHQKAEDYENVRADLLAILELPNVSSGIVTKISYAIAQSYIASENWQKGVESLSEWIAKNDNVGRGPLYLLAVAHYQLDQYEEALPIMERAFALPGASNESHYQLMLGVYTKTDRIAEAKNLLRQMVELFDKPAYQKNLDQLDADYPNFQ